MDNLPPKELLTWIAPLHFLESRELYLFLGLFKDCKPLMVERGDGGERD